ncbi:isoprenoid synthase domain-containing protein [Melanogaster broomeanus]|nr:isoprenoid synthase domain-containing protein [Melanogaster broomeanus]
MPNPQQRRNKFEDVFIRIRDELIERMKAEKMPRKPSSGSIAHNLDYNVPEGKLNRGMSVVDSVEILRGRQLSDDEYFNTAVLGWCIELSSSVAICLLLVADDIMDQSILRRGKPCWYKLEAVENIAINDSMMVEGAIYHLLKKYFRFETYYVHLLELFHEAAYQTEMGQLVDLITTLDVDLSKFSLEKFACLHAQYKAAYYSCYLPVALAMRVCGVPETYTLNGQTIESYKLALSILLPLGEYGQVQDDFLDYAGAPEQIGKIGTDIVDNKCSWCVNIALSVATPEQRKVLDENYGQKDAGKETTVKALYDELRLREIYAVYEESAKERIDKLIQQIPEPEAGIDGGVLRRAVFTSSLNKLYKRTK